MMSNAFLNKGFRDEDEELLGVASGLSGGMSQEHPFMKSRAGAIFPDVQSGMDQVVRSVPTTGAPVVKVDPAVTHAVRPPEAAVAKVEPPVAQGVRPAVMPMETLPNELSVKPPMAEAPAPAAKPWNPEDLRPLGLAPEVTNAQRGLPQKGALGLDVLPQLQDFLGQRDPRSDRDKMRDLLAGFGDESKQQEIYDLILRESQGKAAPGRRTLEWRPEEAASGAYHVYPNHSLGDEMELPPDALSPRRRKPRVGEAPAMPDGTAMPKAADGGVPQRDVMQDAGRAVNDAVQAVQSEAMRGMPRPQTLEHRPERDGAAGLPEYYNEQTLDYRIDRNGPYRRFENADTQTLDYRVDRDGPYRRFEDGIELLSGSGDDQSAPRQRVRNEALLPKEQEVPESKAAPVPEVQRVKVPEWLNMETAQHPNVDNEFIRPLMPRGESDEADGGHATFESFADTWKAMRTRRVVASYDPFDHREESMGHLPPHLRISPQMLAMQQRMRGVPDVEILADLQRYREMAEAYGRERSPEKAEMGMVMVGSDIQKAVMALKNTRKNELKAKLGLELGVSEGDLSSLAKGEMPRVKQEALNRLHEEMKQVDEDPLYQTKRTVHVNGKVMAGGKSLADYSMQEDSHGKVQVFMKPVRENGWEHAPMERLEVPMVTTEELKTELERLKTALNERHEVSIPKARKELEAATLAMRGRKTMAQASHLQGALNTKKAQLEKLTQEHEADQHRALILGSNNGKRVMLEERVKAEVSKPEWRGKVGHYDGLMEIQGGGAQALADIAALTAAITQNEELARDAAQAGADAELVYGGSTRRRLEGGWWNDLALTVQKGIGSEIVYAPLTAATGGSSRTAQVGMKAGANRARSIALHGIVETGIQGMQSVGQSLNDTERRILEAEESGDPELAKKLREDKNNRALASMLIAIGSSKVAPFKQRGLGMGNDMAQDAVSQTVEGFIQTPLYGVQGLDVAELAKNALAGRVSSAPFSPSPLRRQPDSPAPAAAGAGTRVLPLSPGGPSVSPTEVGNHSSGGEGGPAPQLLGPSAGGTPASGSAGGAPSATPPVGLPSSASASASASSLPQGGGAPSATPPGVSGGVAGSASGAPVGSPSSAPASSLPQGGGATSATPPSVPGGATGSVGGAPSATPSAESGNAAPAATPPTVPGSSAASTGGVPAASPSSAPVPSMPQGGSEPSATPPSVPGVPGGAAERQPAGQGQSVSGESVTLPGGTTPVPVPPPAPPNQERGQSVAPLWKGTAPRGEAATLLDRNADGTWQIQLNDQVITAKDSQVKNITGMQQADLDTLVRNQGLDRDHQPAAAVGRTLVENGYAEPAVRQGLQDRARTEFEKKMPGLLDRDTHMMDRGQDLLSSDYEQRRGRPFTPDERDQIQRGEGFHDPVTGQSFVFTSQVVAKEGESPRQSLLRALQHEAVGHGGVNRLLATDPKLTDSFKHLVGKIRGYNPDIYNEVAQDPAYAHLKDDPVALGLEIMARETERRPELLQQNNVFKEMRRMIGDALARLQIKLGLRPEGPADISRQVDMLLNRARKSALKGGEGGTAHVVGDGLQWSRNQSDTPPPPSAGDSTKGAASGTAKVIYRNADGEVISAGGGTVPESLKVPDPEGKVSTPSLLQSSTPTWLPKGVNITSKERAKFADVITSHWEAHVKEHSTFDYPKTRSATPRGIAKAYSDKGFKLESVDLGNGGVRLITQDGYIDILNADTDKPKIQISQMEASGASRVSSDHLLQAAMDWAYNGRKHLDIDQQGSSSTGQLALATNMMLNASRRGSSLHLNHQTGQTAHWQDGRYRENQATLALAEMSETLHAVPAAQSWRYDTKQKQFVDSGGQLLTKEKVDQALADAAEAGVNVDESTLQRSLLTRSVLELARAGEIPRGDYYSVAVEIKLEEQDYGQSRKLHFSRANAAFLQTLESDSNFATHMEKLIPDLRQQLKKKKSEPPKGWVWHHDQDLGMMELVPDNQHTPGSMFWKTLHPFGRGGYSLWAIPNGAPPNR